MRRLLPILVTLLFPALALGETMDDLVKRDGIHYKKSSDVPFTGKVTGKSRGSFKDGKKDGPWITYREIGKLSSQGTYKDRKVDGPWITYWVNGQLLSRGTIKDGRWDGPWVGFNEDGTVWLEYTGTFKDGVKVK